MEEVLFPKRNQLAFSNAVVDPLWSYDVELGLLDDPFNVERCKYSVRDIWLGGGDLRVVVPLYTTNRDP
jgi:hypothetical protein